MKQENRILVEAVADVPVQNVWESWNNPADIMQWNSADPSWHTPRSENDLRVGGKFIRRMEARDGSFGFDFEGIYDTVEPNKEISYTMPDGRQVTTLFSERDGKTHIVTTFDAETQNAPEFQKAGWQAILNNFVKHTEQKTAAKLPA